jgi:hypothetical protein
LPKKEHSSTIDGRCETVTDTIMQQKKQRNENINEKEEKKKNKKEKS